MGDVKADHLWEKFKLIFPDVSGRINSYSRKGNVLYLYTSSKNKLIFVNIDNEWCLCTDKFFTQYTMVMA